MNSFGYQWMIMNRENHSNLWISCGHNIVGMSMAPASGKLISDMILNNKTHIDPSYYAYV